jgi:hypothetical protein
MPLFDDPVNPRLLWPVHARWPRRRAQALLKRFQTEWPELTYDMDLDVGLANAQAFLDQGTRRVRLYGGLVRHRRIGTAGLTLALAHETGHHLGGAPFLPYLKWLSSEERADDWAATVGLPRLMEPPAARRVLRTGREQLTALMPKRIPRASNF